MYRASGQSEATVKIIQKLIRPFVFQDQDWETLLPSLEFAYNDTQQSSTGQTPFYLNYGYHPKGTYRHADTNNPHAEDNVQYLLRLQEAARDTSSIATIKALSPSLTIRNITLVQNTSTSNITSSGPALKMEGLV